MSKFKIIYSSALGDTATLTQVVNEIATKTGVQFEGSLPAYNVKKLDGFSCREILGYVASLCGGNAIIKRNGKFTIVYPTDINRDIGEGVFDFTREEVKYKIEKITCKVSDSETISKGSLGADSMELQFENPWMDATILTDIYNRLNGFEYLGYNIKWQGDPGLDIGDIITYTDDKGVIRKLPIFNMKLSFDGGLDSELSAKGETKNKNSSDSSGSMSKKVNRVVADLAIVNEALIEKANISELIATNAEIANLKAKDVEIENALINKANIEDLTVINASIENLIAADANITKLIATKADITDLTATNIKFNVGSGGTLDLQTLLSKFVSGENGQFLNITSSNTVIANAVIKDAMIENVSVNKLLAGTISTNKFTVASDDGGITIVGPTMQFKDKSNKVRLQLGQDTTGDFNFILRAADGTTTLIDGYGIKEKAIADKLIKSNMVADNAIGEQQINYSSLVTGLNKDTNTQLIKASKVAIDLTGQSLEVSFNSLKSNVDNIEVGGRNLIDGSSKEFENYSTGQFYHRIMAKKLSLLGLRAGDKVTFRVYIKATENKGARARISHYFGDGTKYTTALGNIIALGSEGYSTVTTILREDAHEAGIFISINSADTETTTSAIGQYKEPKFEKGTKATDWTPAIEDVDTKIESNTTAITVAQGKIDGLISENTIIKGNITTISDKYTSLKVTVDGINTTVASHTSSITTIKNTADSALTNANSAINKIDNLEIGGRNLAQGTSNEYSATYNTFNGATNKSITLAKVLTDGLKVGDKVTVRLIYRYDNIVAASGQTATCYIQGAGDVTQWNSGQFTASKKLTLNGSGEYEFLYNFTVTTDHLKNSYWGTNIRHDYVQSGSVKWKMYKVEKGNKATDWSPAPEDIDSSIDSVNTKVTTVENKYTSLEQNLNEFKTTVASTYSTKTELSNVSGTVTSLTSRVSTTESSITQLNNKIALKVESTEVNTIVNNAVNNVQIGGRNLQGNTEFKTDLSGWTVGTGYSRNTSKKFENANTVYFSRTGLTADSVSYLYSGEKAIPIEVGQTVTASGNFYTDNLSTIDSGKAFLGIWFYTSSGSPITSSRTTIPFVNGKWVKCSHTATAPADAFYTAIVIGTTRNGTYYVGKPMFEKGNKAGDWSPSPEDIDSAISTVDTKIETTNNKVATIETSLSSITQRVSSTESNITTINGSISSLQSRMSTAEQKITADAIVSTVRSSTSYTNDLNSKANQSALNTTNSNISGLTTRMNTVEQSITANAITTTISSAITGGTGSISTTQFVMDKTGLTIKNGALKIQNKAGTSVLTGDTNGNLTMVGTLITKGGNNKAVELNGPNMYLYDWEGTTRTNPVGTIFSSRRVINGSTTAIPGFVLANEKNAYMALGYEGTTAYGNYILFDKDGMAGKGSSFPIWVQENMIANCVLGIRNPSKGTYNRLWNSDNNVLVTEISTAAAGEGWQIQTTSGSVLMGIRAGNSYPIVMGTSTQVNGNFTVTGSKNSLQETQNYGQRLINAFETAEYYFGDIGFGKINSDGECYISIDDILQECINLDCKYHIFTQKYNGDITSIDRQRDYFIVYGEPETEFSWQYIAKRKGYENVRLDSPDIGTLEDVAFFTDEDLEVKTTEDTLLDVLTFDLEKLLMEG